MARDYYAKFHSEKTTGAGLVCHPTGTGKTVVIAGLAQHVPEFGSILILTTRTAIRDQLAQELASNLYLDPSKFAVPNPNAIDKSVFLVGESADFSRAACIANRGCVRGLGDDHREFAQARFDRDFENPSISLLEGMSSGKCVVVMTVQLLNNLRANKDTTAVYERLQQQIDLVLFDEGHYEPAMRWSETIRLLNSPTILFSATPFRNDLRPFDIQEGNVCIYRYHDAVREGVVRAVKPVLRPVIRGEQDFCKDILEFCSVEFGGDRALWPRIIVHCDNKAKITRLAKAFIERDCSVAAIHDGFSAKSEDGWRHKSVPPPQQTDALVWIHQYKLMEGIDDHRFRVLAFFDPLRNVRSVVQQVGRTIRTTPGSDDARTSTALLLDHFGGRLAQYWELYRRYDEGLTIELLLKSVSKFYHSRFLAAHPEVDYIDRKFRERLDLKCIPDIIDEVMFDRRVTFRKAPKGSNLVDFEELVELDLELSDCLYEKHRIDDHATIFVYAQVSSPEFLNSRFFAEVRHNARALVTLPDHELIAVVDTRGAGIGGDELSRLERPSLARLQKLISPGSLGRIASVTSQNSSLGNRVVRRRAVSAPSIADLPPGLDEHGHIVSTVTGYNGDRPRITDDVETRLNSSSERSSARDEESHNEVAVLHRYVGLSTARVNETGEPLRLPALREWLNSLAEQMSTGKTPANIYSRFALEAKQKVTSGSARNILLDLYDAEHLFEYVDPETGKRSPLAAADLCLNRVGGGATSGDRQTAEFEVSLNGQPFRFQVSFSVRSQKYRVDSDELDEAFVPSTGARDLPLCRFLNDRQAFNIIPDQDGVIYVHGRFFAPGLKFGERFSRADFFVGSCLYPSEVCRAIRSEKGDHVVDAKGRRTSSSSGDGYDPASLFGLIDRWKDGFDVANLALSMEWSKKYGPPQLSFVPDLIVCDDMSRETGDFFLADEKARRVVLVHAKASSKFQPLSASALQEVCAQAQKNSGPFAMFSLRRPANYSAWDKPHKFAGTGKVQLAVRNRIRKPAGGSKSDAWNRLQALLVHPQTDREIWLVLGNMLSADAFERELTSSSPRPESLQLNHLLQTTIAAAAQMNAKVRIFCAP